MICVAVISMLSSIVTQKPLITHLRMCYVCVMHENITQKNSFEMKFYSALLLAEGKMMKEKQDTCPESLSRWVVVSAVIYMQNLNNTRFSSPRLSNFIPIKYKIGAHPISPPYSFHFITTITFLILTNLERYKHNCYRSLWQIFLKTIPWRKYVPANKEVSCSELISQPYRADPFKGNGMMCIVFYIWLNGNLMFLACLLNCKFTPQRPCKNSRILTTWSEQTNKQYSALIRLPVTHIQPWRC